MSLSLVRGATTFPIGRKGESLTGARTEEGDRIARHGQVKAGLYVVKDGSLEAQGERKFSTASLVINSLNMC